MHYLNKYFMIGFILLSGSAMSGAAATNNSSTQGVECLQATKTPVTTSVDDEEFAKLLEDALVAKKPSMKRILATGTAKWGLKVLCVVCVTMLGCHDFANNYEPGQILTPILCGLLPSILDGLAHPTDQSLVALKKLQKYTSSLTVEQKSKISSLFKEKARQLKTKLADDKDGKTMVAGKLLESALAPLLLLGMCGCATDDNKILSWNKGNMWCNLKTLCTSLTPKNIKNFNQDTYLGIAALLLLCVDLPLNIYNIYNSPDHQKQEIMQNLEAMFATK